MKLCTMRCSASELTMFHKEVFIDLRLSFALQIESSDGVIIVVNKLFPTILIVSCDLELV